MTTLTARQLAASLGSWRTGGPAYLALADRVRLLVLDGRLALGARLPAERELASHLSLSRTTVTAAYAQLRDTGYLDSIRGSGSVVRLPSRAEAEAPPLETDMIDLSKATLPPVPQVADAAVRAAALLPSFLGDSGFDVVGQRMLRRALADRFTARGLPTDPDEILVTNGAQAAIALIARTILGRGDRVLVESPTYPHAMEALRQAGGRLEPVAVTTDDGWDAAALEQVLQRTSPALAYLQPDYHNPTGRSMSPELREKLVAIAARQGTTLIVDETMGELGFDLEPGQPVVPFGVHAASDGVVTVGSVGKTLWGGLRIGWIRADRDLIQRFARARFGSDLGTPILEQLIVNELLPDYDRILLERRELLRTGRDHLRLLLADRIPDWHAPNPAGGLTLWVELGAPISSQLALAARSEGVVIAAGPRFGIDGVFERFLRVPFSFPSQVLDDAVGGLAAAWSGVTRHPLDIGVEDLAAVV
ncbi:PLP-dependent aminotransferase family protein [Pseudolysinimonas kribbensis]|uniref:MocR-like transcription factor YczR n=1 Tax=Pseudolysinimonas kribbensis TaxID=433641 RepID=UPI0031DD812D